MGIQLRGELWTSIDGCGGAFEKVPLLLDVDLESREVEERALRSESPTPDWPV
jgi:hypothetical protein